MQNSISLIYLIMMNLRGENRAEAQPGSPANEKILIK